MKTLARFTLLLPGLFAVCDSALAEDTALVLDPSVVTGSRSASPTFDLPYSVDSISHEQISDGQHSAPLGQGFESCHQPMLEPGALAGPVAQLALLGFGQCTQQAFIKGIRAVQALALFIEQFVAHVVLAHQHPAPAGIGRPGFARAPADARRRRHRCAA